MSKVLQKFEFNQKSELYYNKKDSPNYYNFDNPDLKDENGRLYKLSFKDDNMFNSEKNKKRELNFDGQNNLKLNVKIPKNSKLFNQNKDLRSKKKFEFLNNENKPIILTIEKIFFLNRSKTGFVYVSGENLKDLFTITS
jgi:hypothetical protein